MKKLVRIESIVRGVRLQPDQATLLHGSDGMIEQPSRPDITRPPDPIDKPPPGIKPVPPPDIPPPAGPPDIPPPSRPERGGGVPVF